MKRSVGVTAAAVVLLIGSSILVLLAIRIVPAIVHPQTSVTSQISQTGAQSQTHPAPTPRAAALMARVLVFQVLLAVWGFATTIGILRLRPWARISLLAISIMMSIITIVGLVSLATVFFFLDFRVPLITFIALLATFGLAAVIAAWWLILFTRQHVKQQFAGSG